MDIRMSDRPQDPGALCVVCGKPVGRREGPITFWDLQDRPVCEACAYQVKPGLQRMFQVIGLLVHDDERSQLVWEYAQAEMASCHRFLGFSRTRYGPGGYAQEPDHIAVDYVDRLLLEECPVQVLIPRGVPPELASGLLEEITRSIRSRGYAAPETTPEESA